MTRPTSNRVRRSLAWVVLLSLVWLLCSGNAEAGSLSDRLAAFPNWTEKPSTQPATGDLFYPDWLAGTWEMTSTLVDLTAPLAPDITTPGFESNRSLLNQPVTCKVRFQPKMTSLLGSFLVQPRLAREEIIADRAYNGLNLAQAYLGEDSVQSVQVDPKNPNRQLTTLRGGRQLESTVTSRAVETSEAGKFITTELFQQTFRGGVQPYFNEVETTTAYWKAGQEPLKVEADQVTAVYLSPQDPNYFNAINQPVTLYRYHLEFFPIPGLA